MVHDLSRHGGQKDEAGILHLSDGKAQAGRSGEDTLVHEAREQHQLHQLREILRVVKLWVTEDDRGERHHRGDTDDDVHHAVADRLDDALQRPARHGCPSNELTALGDSVAFFADIDSGGRRGGEGAGRRCLELVACAVLLFLCVARGRLLSDRQPVETLSVGHAGLLRGPVAA